MKSELAAIIRHIIDTFFVVVIATIIVLIALKVERAYCWTVIAWIAQVNNIYITCTVIGFAAVLGWCVPKKVIASIRSLMLLPRHWGLIARGNLGFVLILFIAWITGLMKIERGQLAIIGIRLITLESMVFFVSWALASFKLKLSGGLKSNEMNYKIDDRPIKTLEENLFPEYEVTARRILSRLEVGTGEGARGPNVAVIGPYGSGKTSLCNLVEDICRKERDKSSEYAQEFCRFEAWKFLTADAAVRGLIDTIVSKVQELVDC